MNKKKFKSLMIQADTLKMVSTESNESDYYTGYIRGLRRHYHGENFGTEAEHDKWITLSGHRENMGHGYRDGFAGESPDLERLKCH